MRKIILSFLALFISMGVWSQPAGNAPRPATATGDYDQTIIIARLAFNGELVKANDYLFGNGEGSSGYHPGRIGVKAFVNGTDCTQEGFSEFMPSFFNPGPDVTVSEKAFYYYEISVQNNTEQDLTGENIEIRIPIGNAIYGVTTDCVYTGTTTTYGTLSDPVILNIVTPQITSPISVNIGETVKVADYLVYPDDMATVYTWNGSVVNPGIGSLDMMDEDYAYIDADRKVDFTIKGIAPTPVDDPVHMTLFVEGFSDYLLPFDVIVAPIRVTGIENVSLPTIMYVGQRYSSNDLPSMINVLPENATNKYVNWASSNEEVLMANGREIRAFKPGESTITVASVDNEEINVRSLVTVYNSISSVAFNKVEVTVEKGGTIDLKKYVTTSPTDNLYDVQYSFSIVNEWDEEYISISDDGILTGLKTNGYGWAQVAVSAEDGFGNTASSETYLGVIVHAGVTSLVLPEKDEIMWVDDIKELHDLVTVLPEDANYQGLDYTITNVDVESDEVIIQDAYDEMGYGHLLAVNPGKARIDVVSEDNENVKGSFIIEVRAHVKDIEVPEDGITVEAFDKVLLDEYITVYPEDAYDKSVTWEVADTTEFIELTQENGSWYVTMKRTGSVPLTVTSNENSEISTTVFVYSTAAVTGIVTPTDKQILWTNGEPSAVPVSDLYDVTPKYATNQDVTWVVNSDDYIIEVWEWSNEYSGAAVKARNVGEASLTLTTKDGGYEGTVEFEVRAHTEYIEMSTEMIEAKVGEVVSLDEVEYSIGPDDAYDKSVTWSVDEDSEQGIVEIIEKDGAWSFKALMGGEATLKVATVDNPDNAFAYITVFVKLYPTGLEFEDPNQTVYPDQEVNVGFTLSPEGVDPEWFGIEWNFDPEIFDFSDIDEYEDEDAVIHYFSSATVIPNVMVLGSVEPGEYTIKARPDLEGYEWEALTVTVPATITSITLVDAETESEDIYLTTNETRLVNIVVEPEDALFEPAIGADGGTSLEILYENPSFDGMEDWTTGEVKLTGNAEDGYAIKLTPYMTGEYRLYVRYNYPGNEIESSNDEENVHVGAGLSLSDGWNWISTPSAETFPTQSEFAETFGTELEEVRARYSASFKDPVYGFFGTLSSMNSNTAYKLKFDGTPEQYTFYGIDNMSVVMKGMDTQLSAGWNWVAYPYEYDYSVEELIENDIFYSFLNAADASSELTIVAQDGSIGVVSSDGNDISYEGNLEAMVHGKCYMVYAPTACNLIWPETTRLGQRISVPVRAAGYRTDGISSPFIYDIHQFADVMAMIATVDGLDVPGNCIVGAFVDGECRGMGNYSNGKFFIGVHGEKNDVVVFKAYDTKNDLWYDIDQLIQFTTLVGSIKEPARLSISTITSVDNVLRENTNGTIYDVTGRRVDVSVSAGVYVTKGKKMFVK